MKLLQTCDVGVRFIEPESLIVGAIHVEHPARGGELPLHLLFLVGEALVERSEIPL
jgi:hypothetical protein